MLRPPTRASRGLLSVSVALTAALVSVGVSAPSATAAGDDAMVATIGELQVVATGCTGTGADPTLITLAGDITAAGDQVTLDCHAVLDLAGHDLAVRNIIINSAQALTVDDTGTDGTLTANAATVDSLSGIQNTDASLTIDGGTVTATGGHLGGGIGGGQYGGGGTTTVNAGTVHATGGYLAAGVGGGEYGGGGTTAIHGGTVTATGGVYGAGIGGGYGGGGGTTTVNGGTATATSVYYGAGIGGGYGGGGGATTVNGGTVDATAAYSGAGIGGGAYRPDGGGITTVNGGTVTATGGDYGAGIGGGEYSAGGATAVNGGTVIATGGDYGAGIGGGHEGGGGTTAVNGGTVTATGGDYGAGIGGGSRGGGGSTTVRDGTVDAIGGIAAAGVGGGAFGGGAVVSVEGGTLTAATVTGGRSTVGAGDAETWFGSLSVTGGVLRLPSGFLRVSDSAIGAEITIGPAGVIDGSAGPGATYATVVGAGQVDNGGRIRLPAANLTAGGVTVSDRHYAVSFDTQGGSTAPGAVKVFADTFDHGGRVLPADPTKSGAVFGGWNTAADGSGDPVTATSTLRGKSVDATPVPITAYAQWRSRPAVTGIAPSSGSTTGGTVVVITGTDFSGATKVRFGTAGEATSFTVDSATQITATAPSAATAGVRHIRVTTPGGLSPAVTADRFRYTAPAPALTGIAPSSGPTTGGTVVVITGTDFTRATRVKFGTAGEATSFTVHSATRITATSPASATTGVRNIRVTTPGGTSPVATAGRYTYTPSSP